MPATKKRVYARYTLAAVDLLGSLVRIERTHRRMTAQEFAERLGITRGTLARLESGDPKVELGLAFEACALLCIDLFEADATALAARRDEAHRRIALLPKHVRLTHQAADDDF